MDLQSLFNIQLISLSPVSDVITRDKRFEEMIQTSKRGWFMPWRMVCWWRANFSFQSYTILTRSYIIPGSLMLSLELKGEKKTHMGHGVWRTSFPGFFIFLPRGTKRENPGNKVGVRWPFAAKFVNEKTQLLCKWVFKLKAVLYFSVPVPDCSNYKYSREFIKEGIMTEIAETKTRRDDFSLISCLPSRLSPVTLVYIRA